MSDATKSNPPKSLLRQVSPSRRWLAIAFHNGEEEIVGTGLDKWDAMIDAAANGFFGVVLRPLPEGAEALQ